MKAIYAWQIPSDRVHDIFKRPYDQSLGIIEKQDKIIFRDRNLYVPLEWLAQEIVYYGEIGIYEKSRARPRSNIISSFEIGNIIFAKTNSKSSISLPQKILLPENGVFGTEILSISQNSLLLYEYQTEKIVLWYVDINTLETRILLDGGITQVFGNIAEWFPDNINVLIPLIPENLKKPELDFSVPSGPIVLETSGNTSESRTFPNLLKDTHEEKLFEYYATSQLAIINTITGDVRKISQLGFINHYSISPDSRFIIINELVKPYSQKVPYYAFPNRWYVYDCEKDETIELATHEVRELKRGWTAAGRRSFFWHPFEKATLIYVNALDEGDPNKQVPYRDELKLLTYPFKGDGDAFLYTEERFSAITFIEKNAFLYEEFIWQSNVRLSYLVNSKSEKHLINRRNRGEIYDQPGSMITTMLPNGYAVGFVKDNSIYFSGDGLSAESRKPFIDKLHLETFQKKRVLEFDDPEYHIDIQGFYHDDPNKAIIIKQNRTTPPNWYIVSLNDTYETPLSKNIDTVPELTNLQKRVIRYYRDDGIELSGILYLPENYDGSTRLPLLMSAYPREFSDSVTASQSSHSENRFVRPFGSTNVYMCFNNIAVLENASFPVVGDIETVNNTYIAQNISNAKAAIDYLDKQGIIDPQKVVIQGHSYGAFMVANLLAHSDLFAGGIAQNGAYNRTLTPFGFQAERRTLWEARDTYLNMSPFLYVKQIQAPLLLIHSTKDQNSGTFPIQSRRLFEALEGNGKISRFVQLPLEGHIYRAQETYLQLMWEYENFFEKYIFDE